MKKAFAALALSLMLVGSCFAATVTKNVKVDWTYPVEQNDAIDGFRVYNQSGTVVADNINKTLRTLSVPYTYDDATIQSFTIVAFKSDGQMSDFGTIKSVAPKFKPIIGVGTFTVEITQ